MSQKLMQLILLFEQLEAWDTYPTWIEKEGGLFGDINEFNLYGRSSSSESKVLKPTS